MLILNKEKISSSSAEGMAEWLRIPVSQPWGSAFDTIISWDRFKQVMRAYLVCVAKRYMRESHALYWGMSKHEEHW